MEIVRQKNVATIISFPLVDANGVLVTSSGNPDSEIDAYTDGAIPNGFVSCTNEATEVGTSGWYHLSLTQAEMNVDYINLQIKSDGALTQCLIIRTIVGDPLLLATTASTDAIKTDTAAILLDTDTMEADLTTEINANKTKIDTAITDIAAVKADISELATEANATTNKNTIVTEVDANEMKINTMQGNVTSILTDTETTIPNQISALNDPTAVVVATTVWNRILTAATHNIASSAGRRLRQLGDVLNASVNDASATTTSFITDLTEDTDDFYTEQYLRFVEGNLSGQIRIVTAYNGTTNRITICPEHPFTESPANGDEFGLIPVHVHALSEIIDKVWAEDGRSLSTPADYKTDVSELALEVTVQSIKALTDNLPADTELELIKLKGVGGIWLVAEYHHDENNDNDYIEFWQYGNQTDFDNETKVNAVNKWRQDVSYSSNLPVKSKWDKVA